MAQAKALPLGQKDAAPHDGRQETDAMARLVGEVVARARVAQTGFATATQEQADSAVRALAWSLYQPENARRVAELAVADTGLGNIEDKIIKKQRKTFGTLRDLLRVKSVGIIERDAARGLTKMPSRWALSRP